MAVHLSDLAHRRSTRNEGSRSSPHDGFVTGLVPNRAIRVRGVVQDSTGVVQCGLKCTLKFRSDRKKERKRMSAKQQKAQRTQISTLWPYGLQPLPVGACRPLPALGHFIIAILTPHRERHGGVGPALVPAAYTPDTDIDIDTRPSSLPSRMSSCGAEPIASPRQEPTPRAVRATRW